MSGKRPILSRGVKDAGLAPTGCLNPAGSREGEGVCRKKIQFTGSACICLSRSNHVRPFEDANGLGRERPGGFAGEKPSS